MTVLREGSVTDLSTIAHVIGHVADEDRHPTSGLHNDVADVVNRPHEAFATNETCHVVFLDIRTTGIAIVAVQRLINLIDRHLHGFQPLGVERHLILFDASAKGVDFYNTGNHGELSLHDPVLDSTQLLWRIFGGILRNERVLVDLTQARRDRPHLRRAEAFGNLRAYLLELLLDKLTRKVSTHIVLEDNGDNGEPETGH